MLQSLAINRSYVFSIGKVDYVTLDYPMILGLRGKLVIVLWLLHTPISSEWIVCMFSLLAGYFINVVLYWDSVVKLLIASRPLYDHTTLERIVRMHHYPQGRLYWYCTILGMCSKAADRIKTTLWSHHARTNHLYASLLAGQALLTLYYPRILDDH